MEEEFNLDKEAYDMYIHLSMLQDRVRVNSYIEAFSKNQVDFRDKVVMDIGAGSGILTILAIRNGARKVYAIEGQDSMIPTLRQMLRNNGVEDKVTIINDMSTNVEVGKNIDEKVDVIIHELIGTYAVNERGLECIVDAKDRLLKDDGKIFPNKLKLKFALCSELPNSFIGDSSLDYSGVDMSLFKKFYKDIYCQPRKDIIHSIRDNTIKFKNLESSNALEYVIDLKNDSIESMKNIRISGIFNAWRKCNALASWFDVFYEGSTETVSYTTLDNITNWGVQYVLFNDGMFGKDKSGVFDAIILFKINDGMSYMLSIDIATQSGEKVLNRSFDTLANNVWIDTPLHGSNYELLTQ